jgi:hypothetical protein
MLGLSENSTRFTEEGLAGVSGQTREVRNPPD